MSEKERCFFCDTVLGSTRMPAQHGIPATCIRCGGRVHGAIVAAVERATAPLIAILREVEWAAGDDLSGTICVCCGAGRDDAGEGYDHKNPAPHAVDCALAMAIGARTVGETMAEENVEVFEAGTRVLIRWEGDGTFGSGVEQFGKIVEAIDEAMAVDIDDDTEGPYLFKRVREEGSGAGLGTGGAWLEDNGSCTPVRFSRVLP